MKKYCYIFLVALGVSSVSYGQEIEIKGPADTTNVDSVSFVQPINVSEQIDTLNRPNIFSDSVNRKIKRIGDVKISLNASYSFINQKNSYYAFNTGFYGKNIVFEPSFFNVSTIKYDNINYVSSNTLIPIIIMVPLGTLMALFTSLGAENSFLAAGAIGGIPASAAGLSNIKFGYPLNKYIVLVTGQRTDYYLFYHVSKICTQSQIGVNLNIYKISVNALINIPWTKGYSDKKEPYLSTGLGFNIFSRIDTTYAKD